MLRIKLNVDALRRAVERTKLGSTLDRVMAERAERGAVEARADAPVATGALRDSIVVEKVTGKVATYRVKITAPYAPYVVNPTRPHRIHARRAKALRWVDAASGEVRFAAWVDHPGTKGQPFLADAVRRGAGGR